MYTSDTSSGRMRPKSINVPRNKFNKSKGRFFELPMGLIAPFHVERILPNDTIDTSYDIAIENRNPMKKPITNNIRFYVKTYFNRDIDLWEGALRFHDKGIRQDQALEMPKLLPYAVTASEDTSTSDPWENIRTSTTYKNLVISATPLSPWDYMGLPWIWYNKKLGNGTTDRAPKYSGCYQAWKVGGTIQDTGIENFYYEGEGTTPLAVNALPFVMYAKIKRKDFTDSNLTMRNTGWYPDQDDKFRLPYNCNSNTYGTYNKNTRNYVNSLDYEYPLQMRASWSVQTKNKLIDRLSIPSNNTQARQSSHYWVNCPKLNVSFYAPWHMDYFTGASPFAELIRNGTTLPTISMNMNANDAVVNTAHSVTTTEQVGITANGFTNNYGGQNLRDALERIKSTTNIMSMRDALAKTLICERIGLIENHDFYNGYMNTIYGSNVHGECHDPIYIGGGYVDYSQSTVENTSDPNDSTKEAQLGYKSANGGASTTINGGIYNSNDFGWYMAVMYAIPDTIYNGGIEKTWKQLTQAEDYNPLLQGTSPQAILKYELSLPENATDWRNVDKAWGYTKRDEQYKNGYNTITGFGACRDPNEFILDQAYFIKREFTTSTAELNEENIECTPDNCKSLAWASQTEPEFKVAVKCNCYITREMMKSAEPSNLGMFN